MGFTVPQKGGLYVYVYLVFDLTNLFSSEILAYFAITQFKVKKVLDWLTGRSNGRGA